MRHGIERRIDKLERAFAPPTLPKHVIRIIAESDAEAASKKATSEAEALRSGVVQSADEIEFIIFRIVDPPSRVA